MNKTTELLITTVVLGGIGYFLYKKGFFDNIMSNKTAPNPLPVTNPIQPSPVLIEQPTFDTPIQIKVEDPAYSESYYQALDLPKVDDFKNKPIFVNEPINNLVLTNAETNTYPINNDFKLGISPNYHYK